MRGLLEWVDQHIFTKAFNHDSKSTEDIDEYFIRLSTLMNTYVSINPEIITMFERDRHSIVYLPIEYVMAVRDYIIELYSQTDDPIQKGLLSEGNLGYSMKYVADMYNDIESKEEAIKKKSAFIMYNLISKHPFADGNKRSGITICNSFLEFNGFTLGTLPFRESYEFITDVAMGGKTERDCEKFIRKHVKPLAVPEDAKEALRKVFENVRART